MESKILYAYVGERGSQDMTVDKVCMYEEMMTNNDNVESSLPTSNLLKICSLYNFCYK